MMNEADKQLLIDFMEEHWDALEEFLVRRGFGVMHSDDKALELLNEFEQLTTN